MRTQHRAGSSLLFLVSWAASASARLSVVDDPDDDINNSRNNRYTATLTVNGLPLNVTLDTGSTDMWINAPNDFGPFEDTGVTHNISYGDGSAYINGTIGFADVKVAGYRIPRQAFINVTESVGLNECESTGIFGLIGLGFNSPSVGISDSFSNAGINGTALGKSVLSNIFDANPDKERFFAFSFSRLGDKKLSADASLNIGEYDEKYADVQWETKRPVFPATGQNWRILSDGLSVNDAPISWTAKKASMAPGGKKVIGLDTGTSNMLMKPEIVAEIYSAIPGAVLAKNSSLWNTHWSADKDVWVVPCNASVSLTATFEGHPYPIHPLDLTDMYTRVGPDGVNYTICVGAITNGGSLTSGGSDGLYGLTFLRNVYTVFSFGDNTTAPSVQFLSQTNAWAAANDFQRVRKRVLARNPPELAPADLVRLFDSDPSSAGSSASPLPTSDLPDSASTLPNLDPSPTAPALSTSSTAPSTRPSTTVGPPSASSCPTLGSTKSAVNLADSFSQNSDDSALNNYGPTIIGLLAGNMLILLVLVFLGVMRFIRGGRKVGTTRAYVPVKLREEDGSFEDKTYA
ncbi:aspartic peptidase domain-containing protein [Mycena crocata]|nr:aspartic peptidase domain-containing protein [Mycena crocata]